MKKILLLSTCALIGFSLPAFAETDSEKLQDIRNDSGAVHKDDAAIAHDNDNLAANRAAKAKDKANGNWGSQAVDSAKIGGNQAAVSEKKSEKDVDQNIMQHDINK